MNWKQILLVLVLADFLAFSGWVVYHYGYIGIFEALLANGAAMQGFVDLVLALSLVSIWMFKDARSRGVSPWPYLVLTLVLGSVGPLAYLIRREGKVASQATAPGSTGVAPGRSVGHPA